MNMMMKVISKVSALILDIFPEARNIFVKHEVYNRYNDGQRLTFDDFFFRRMFNSYVIKNQMFMIDIFLKSILEWMHCLKVNA